jgi:predicted peptidase
MSVFRSCIIVVLMLAVPSFAEDGFADESFTAAMGTLPYRILSPSEAKPDVKYPLIIFLHGAGERGDDNSRQTHHGGSQFLNKDNRERFPAFVVFPQCPNGRRWVEVNWGEAASHKQPEQPSEPMSLVMKMIPSLLTSLPVDPSRVYLMGISMGGFGAWDLAARQPGWFAAVVPVCGGADSSTAPLLVNTPIWAFHGDEDNVINVNRSRIMVEAIKQAGGAPKYTEYPDVSHNSWFKAFAEPELLAWLFAQQRPQ